MIFLGIDVQSRYLPFGPTLDAVVDELKATMAAGKPIVLLRYPFGGEIYEHILDLVRGYKQHVVVDKRTYGGGKEVVEVCRVKGWDMSVVRVGGACTYCCVSETCEQLLAAAPDTIQEVVGKACYDTYVGGPFPRHDNIRWV